MKNELGKIKGELVRYIKNLDEDTYIPPAGTASSGMQAPKIFPAAVGMSQVTSHKSQVTTTPVSASAAAQEKPEPRVRKKAAKEGTSHADPLLSLKEEVLKCRKCLLGLSRINAVFGVGDPKAKVMFIGEGPGYDEDRRGEPFVGRAGQLLDKILAAINLSRETVYIANIVKCHPMINPETRDARGNDRPPTPAEISACRHYLEEQIRLIKPLCVVTLGNVATRFMLNETKGISQLRGKMYDVPYSFTFDFDLKVLPTYHPAALLRNPPLKKDAWEDMKMLMAFLGKNAG